MINNGGIKFVKKYYIEFNITNQTSLKFTV